MMPPTKARCELLPGIYLLGTPVNKGKGMGWDAVPRPSGSSCYLLTVYGNPTIDFSVVSVTLVSVPAPPFKESLPLTPSFELTVSLLPSP
jgi:hypothetical protein